MRIACNFNKRLYTKKPSRADIVQQELAEPAEIELRDLANLLVRGGNFRPAAVNGTNDSGWLSQQLFALDFDNSIRKKPLPEDDRISPEAAVNLAVNAGLTPAFVYSTYSDKPNLRKFRVCFCLEKPVFDLDRRNAIQAALAGRFSKWVDPACMNPARIFYGTNTGDFIFSSFDSFITADQVLAGAPFEEKRPQKTVGRSSKKITLIDFRNVEAIKNHDVAFLQKKLGVEQETIFDTRADFFNHLYHEISLADFLGVPENEAFPCLFHDDKHPSASVFTTRSGVQLYKCFSGCIPNLNIKQITEILGDFKSEFASLEFLKRVFRLSIRETEWSREQKENIDFILNCLSREDDFGFCNLCPTADRTTRNAQRIFIQILCLAKDLIFSDITGRDGEIIFYMSNRQLQRKTGGKSLDKLSRYVKLLCYHGMLDIVPENEIPPSYLRSALKGKHDDHYHVTFYRLKSWVVPQLLSIESQAAKWKEHGYRLHGISFECFLRSEGKDVATQLYPQYSVLNAKGDMRQLTKSSNARHDEISLQVLTSVKEKGFTTEREIIDEIGKNNGMTEIQLKRSIDEIMITYGLKKVRANKELKEKFHIQRKGYPNIIIVDD